MITSPTLETALSNFVDAKIGGIFTAMPGRIEAYDASTQKATVMPLVQVAHIDEAGNRVARTIAPIVDVPVMFPGMGGFRITFPVFVGQTVLILFAGVSIDRWLARGGVIDPGDDRKHSVSDAIAVPGLYDFAHLPTDTSQSAIVLHGEEIRLGSPAAVNGVATRQDLVQLKNILTSAPDGGSYGTNLKALLDSDPWPICSQKVKAE